MLGLGANAQITKSDSLFITSLRTELQLSDSQFVDIDSIFQQSQKRISEIDKEVLRISRSDSTQEVKDEKTKVLVSEKRNLKELRELNTLLILTPDQKKKYEEKQKLATPGTLHFGANHDRASCTVCIPK